MPAALQVCDRCVPIIVTSESINVGSGSPFDYQIIATGNNLIYSATGLPSGLSINSGTGLISGSTSVALGVYPISLTVSNGKRNGKGILMLTVVTNTIQFIIESGNNTDNFPTQIVEYSFDGGPYITLPYDPLGSSKILKYVNAITQMKFRVSRQPLGATTPCFAPEFKLVNNANGNTLIKSTSLARAQYTGTYPDSIIAQVINGSGTSYITTPVIITGSGALVSQPISAQSIGNGHVVLQAGWTELGSTDVISAFFAELILDLGA